MSDDYQRSRRGSVPHVPLRPSSPRDDFEFGRDPMTPGDRLAVAALFLCLSPWFVGFYEVVMWIWGLFS